MPSSARVLLTGSTGFLGGAVLMELLAGDRAAQLLLLVRSADQSAGHARVVANLRRFAASDALIGRLSPSQIVCGDLTNLHVFQGDERLRLVSHVLNCAAVTSFGHHPLIWRTNVEGTVALAQQLRQLPKLQRVVHVGTAMICGDDPPARVHEDSYPREGVRHLVPYTSSKAEAERRLREILPDTTLVVARPSIVVGHSQLGCGPSHSIFWAFRMSHALRRVTCPVDGIIDVVPVDYAARALVLLLTKPKLAHRTYHISADQQSCTFAAIGAAFDAALGTVGEGCYRTVTYKDMVGLQDRFHEVFGRCNRRFMLKAIQLYGGFAALNTRFDQSRLRDEGMAPPPRFSDYLAHCVATSHATIAQQMLTDFQ
jgi:nucleoside-diphosphate-sugar epimerase